MRLDEIEKEALKHSLKNFSGEVYLFGSRLNDDMRGGDIDILIKPSEPGNAVRLSLEIQKKFFSRCEQSLDVIVYGDNPFCEEILKHAEKIDIERI